MWSIIIRSFKIFTPESTKIASINIKEVSNLDQTMDTLQYHSSCDVKIFYIVNTWDITQLKTEINLIKLKSVSNTHENVGNKYRMLHRQSLHYCWLEKLFKGLFHLTKRIPSNTALNPQHGKDQQKSAGSNNR